MVKPDVQAELEEFTCIMYGEPRETSVNTVRNKMIMKMVGDDLNPSSKSKVDLVKLPPCQNSLIPHVQRANYRVCCYKRANVPIFDKPKAYDKDCGWTKTDEGVIEPLWSNGPILPPSLVDLLVSTQTEVERSADVDEVESDELDFDDMLDYLNDDD